MPIHDHTFPPRGLRAATSSVPRTAKQPATRAKKNLTERKAPRGLRAAPAARLVQQQHNPPGKEHTIPAPRGLRAATSSVPRTAKQPATRAKKNLTERKAPRGLRAATAARLVQQQHNPPGKEHTIPAPRGL